MIQLIYIFYTRIINEILLLATNDKNKIEVIKIMENKRKRKVVITYEQY